MNLSANLQKNVIFVGMSEIKGITLFELQERIKNSLTASFNHQIWIRGEISSIKANVSGHCYIDLIDKDEDAANVTATARAVVWSSYWKILRPYFESTTGSPLSAGMNILVKVQVQYSELYGLTLVISDIDPSYTVGELELKRIKVIQRLKSEGMFDMNSSLEFPALPKRFAVISSEQAAGYRDFIEHLHKNDYGFKFYTELFSAPMQGATAPQGIIAAMEQVAEGEFDAVLILRGGGSAMDLSFFDDYDLAVNIAQFPIPVLTAVGHDQDYHICDMVAFQYLKTPTALADFIIDIYLGEDARILSLASRLSLALVGKYKSANSDLDALLQRIKHSILLRYSKERGKVDLLEQRVAKGNPFALLKSGYAIAMKEGKRVDSVAMVAEGERVSVVLNDGIIECLVETIKNK